MGQHAGRPPLRSTDGTYTSQKENGCKKVGIHEAGDILSPGIHEIKVSRHFCTRQLPRSSIRPLRDDVGGHWVRASWCFEFVGLFCCAQSVQARAHCVRSMRNIMWMSTDGSEIMAMWM